MSATVGGVVDKEVHRMVTHISEMMIGYNHDIRLVFYESLISQLRVIANEIPIPGDAGYEGYEAAN